MLAPKKYNFGPVFINWINIIYNDISSCVYNNGKTSKYFSRASPKQLLGASSPDNVTLALKSNVG